MQTKENIKVIREKLKKQEQEAWLETTKNLVRKDKTEANEIQALTKLIIGHRKTDDQTLLEE